MTVPQQVVGDFESGDEYQWSSPLVFKQYRLSGVNHPDTFVMNQIFTETDWGCLGDFSLQMSAIVMSTLTAVGTAIGSAVTAGGTIGMVAGPIGAVIGVVGAIIGVIIGAIGSVPRDDIFPVMTMGLQVPFEGGQNPTPILTTTFSDFGATYHRDHSWELSWKD